MKWTEQIICRTISTQIFNRRCILLIDNCQWTGHECDVLGVTMDMRIIDIEVKISRADFKQDAKKEKWWHRPWNWQYELGHEHGAPAPDRKLSHPIKVWKHYFAMPEEIWKPELLEFLPSQSSGVLLLREPKNLQLIPTVKIVKHAKPDRKADRITPADILDIARLQNIRMWEAYDKAGKK